MSSADDLLRSASARLGSAQEARWIVAHVLGSTPLGDTRSFAERSRDTELDAAREAAVNEMVSRRLCGEPLQYVLGTWQFRSLEVAVDERVLIPRPETEHVVTYALEELAAVARELDAEGRNRISVVDLGTGSGVIALAIAAEATPAAGHFFDARGSSRLEIWATDVSEDALVVARCNAAAVARENPYVAERLRFASGDWFGALSPELAGSLSLVVSNPPYVSAAEWEELDGEVREHEPRTALVSGDTGREALELIVREAPTWLEPGGTLVLEIAPHQSEALSEAAASAGFIDVRVEPDLAGRPRALLARAPRTKRQRSPRS